MGLDENTSNSAIAIIGGSGAIGKALIHRYLEEDPLVTIYSLSRRTPGIHNERVRFIPVDLEIESTIENAKKSIGQGVQLQRIIVATGILQQENITPEKTFKDINPESFLQMIKINTLGPALVIKHLWPLIDRRQKSVISFLSARVGSISDNRLGGWYSYRASKAALNMIIKNLSIEFKRSLPQSVVIGLHPGTVHSELSSPFLKNTEDKKIFSPDFSAQRLYEIIESVHQDLSGQIIDWKGNVIEY